MKVHAIRGKRLAATLALATVVATAASQAGERTDILSEGSLAKAWQPVAGATLPTPAFPAIVPDKSDQVCVTVGYTVNPDGSTTGPGLLKSWSAAHPKGDEHAEYIQPFARNAFAAVQQWHYASQREGKARPAYTSITFTFGNPSPEVREHCAIDNLPSFIAKAQSEAFRRGNLKKGDEEHLRQLPTVVPTTSGYKVQ